MAEQPITVAAASIAASAFLRYPDLIFSLSLAYQFQEGVHVRSVLGHGANMP
jgi:hypothetical protein